MIEHTVGIPTGDGAMPSFVCHPERQTPHPPVLMLMDAPGIREELCDMARRLATVGYYVVLMVSASRSAGATTNQPRSGIGKG